MLIFFILTFIITAKATEDTKYIDLLPEKDKQIFLDRVARRILEEVDSKPSKQKSGEVPEDELDVHAEFVKKILKEEESNLRKRNNNDKEDLSVKPLDKDKKVIDLTLRSRTKRNADSNLENNNAQSDNKAQFIKFPDSLSDEKDIQIKDFKIKLKDNNSTVEPEANNDDVQTISTDKVAVETEAPTTENQNNVIKVKNNTLNFSDADEPKINTTDKTNASSLLNSDTKLTSEVDENKSFSQSNIPQNINDDNQKGNKPIASNITSTKKHEHDINETDTKTELKKVEAKEKLGTRNTTFLDVPVQIVRVEDSVKNIEETSSKGGTIPTEKVMYTTTQKPVENLEIAEKRETTTETNISELEAKEKNKKDVNVVRDKIESYKETNDSRTEEVSVKNFRISTVNISDIDEFKINSTNTTNNNLFIDLETAPKTLQSSVNVDTKIMQTSISQRAMKDMKPVNKRELEATTQKIEILTPLTPLTSKYETNNYKNEENHTKEVDSKIIQVLRDVIERNKVISNGKFDGIKSIHKIKKHKVYELPTADKILVLDDNVNKEQPYYYPIYNYSPNNAYYNAHNNFGLNQNDLGVQKNINQEKDDEGKGNFETDYFFDDDNNNREYKYGYTDGSENIRDKFPFKLPIVVEYPIKLNTDYDDPDIERNRNAKSKKKDNIEENKLKTSLREIRMMMYANRMFGHIPENRTYVSVEADSSEEPKDKSNLRAAFEAILEREKNDLENRIIADESNFAVDYYFSRMNPNSKTNKKNRIRQENTGTKDIIQKLFDENYKIYVIDPTYLKPKINENYIARKEEKKPNFENIQKILKMANTEDVLSTLNRLLEMNITRSGVEERNVEIYADVLADLVQTDNTALVQYDWLGTTVNIQGATMKLLELTKLVLDKKYINPSDLELLKYMIYLYKKANIMNQYQEELRMNLPRGKHMKRKVIKTKGLIDRVWLFRQSDDADELKISNNDVKMFGEFLDELLNSLYELHTAIKEIASITKYNHQHWFKNLKELYLNKTGKTILELLLHFTANQVLDFVEESAKNGLENDYYKYIKQNEKEVKRTESDFVFLVKILNEINNNE